MKLRQALINLITPPDPAKDLRAARTELALHLSSAAQSGGYQVKGFQTSVSGPLGGESARFDLVGADGEVFIVSIYAKGLFAADNEQVRAVLAANNRFDREQ